MTTPTSRITIHMAASLDGFIARRDGSVDWIETSDEFPDGRAMDPEFVDDFLETIDCYVMGSRTYETALRFEAQGLGWSYGDKPVFVLTSRELPRTRDTVEFRAATLRSSLNESLRPRFSSIWLVGGSACSPASASDAGSPTRFAFSILPILIGDGIRFFELLDRDIALHLTEVNAYKNGVVDLRYEVRKEHSQRPSPTLVPRCRGQGDDGTRLAPPIRKRLSGACGGAQGDQPPYFTACISRSSVAMWLCWSGMN